MKNKLDILSIIYIVLILFIFVGFTVVNTYHSFNYIIYTVLLVDGLILFISAIAAILTVLYEDDDKYIMS